MIVSAFVDVLLPIIVVVSCGYALRRAFPIDLRSLNRVSLYALGPALIFSTLVRIEVSGDEALRIVAVSILLFVVMAAVTVVSAAPLALSQASMAGLLLCTLFMNAGNYGLSTARFAFGDEGLQRALLFFIPQSILTQVLAVPIAQLGTGKLSDSVRQILRMPQIYAASAGLIIRSLGFHLAERTDMLGALFNGVALLAEAALPLMLLILGMQLAVGVAIEERGLTGVATVLRLFASPLVALGLGWLFGLSSLALYVVVIQASMPTAVNTVVYSMEFNARPGFVAGVVVVTTGLSLVTLAILLTFLRV